MATVITLRRTSQFIGSFQFSVRPCRHFTVLLPISTYTRNPSTSGPLGIGFERLGFHDHLIPNRNTRGFAKGRKSKARADDSDDGDRDGGGGFDDVGSIVKETAMSQMEAAKEALTRELSKLRTGRASEGMLDHIIVEINGAKMPLNRVSLVSVLDPKTLSVMPYDPNALKSLHTAIVNSPLGLNPTDDGQRLIAVIPPLTKENTQALCKVVSKHSEDVKQSIRRARQKAIDSIKKAGSSIPKDNAKRLEKEVDEITKRFVKSAEEICKAKDKEISGNSR
ncbi:putative Ribosome recycling factor [Zostera marina]|uniref:Ribosome-recycling factor, chloroplastic n=1 Tax=Zostera marina TaxID=29655 RepID=A0A0K9PI26_ZOSMR|nr:putative Ribosome recycling factor [Zostera marina]